MTYQSNWRNWPKKDIVKPASLPGKCIIHPFTLHYVHSPTIAYIWITLFEFLESSKIHGLVYISTSKSTLAKLLWTVITMVGFGTAGYLIYDSFNDWAESPTVTSVEIFPISELSLIHI